MTEIIVSAKTIEEAVEKGSSELGKAASEVKYEVVEEPKKGFLGIGASDAKVRVYIDVKTAEVSKTEEVSEETEADTEPASEIIADVSSPEGVAVAFLNHLIADLGVDAEAVITGEKEEVSEKGTLEKDVYVEINGEGLGTLIGRHGDVLDSLQYLANITAGRAQKNNPDRKEYVKICLDIENYRAKREETLKALAIRKAEQAISTHRNIALEPMLAYERRIIHAELQNFEGVYTYSVGSDNDRKVIIALGTPDNPVNPGFGRKPYGSSYGGRNYRR